VPKPAADKKRQQVSQPAIQENNVCLCRVFSGKSPCVLTGSSQARSCRKLHAGQNTVQGALLGPEEGWLCCAGMCWSP
jgi:hypothetical protein